MKIPTIPLYFNEKSKLYLYNKECHCNFCHKEIKQEMPIFISCSYSKNNSFLEVSCFPCREKIINKGFVNSLLMAIRTNKIPKDAQPVILDTPELIHTNINNFEAAQIKTKDVHIKDKTRYSGRKEVLIEDNSLKRSIEEIDKPLSLEELNNELNLISQSLPMNKEIGYKEKILIGVETSRKDNFS